MPRAKRVKNDTPEHEETATTTTRPRKGRASKKEAGHTSKTCRNGAEEGSNKGPEGPEEGGTFPHLTTMPLQSWGDAPSRGTPAIQRLAPHSQRQR